MLRAQQEPLVMELSVRIALRPTSLAIHINRAQGASQGLSRTQSAQDAWHVRVLHTLPLVMYVSLVPGIL